MVVELEFDDTTAYDNEDGRIWFEEEVLKGKESDLLLHSIYIGEIVGELKVIEIIGE
jgi:hypothetical protein